MLKLLHLLLLASYVPLRILSLQVEVTVLLRQSLNCLVKLFDLEVCISVVLKNVLFLKLHCPLSLVGFPLSISELIVLLFEDLVRMRRLTELLIHKAVLSCQCLNVLSKFSNFLGFQLSQLSLLVDLLSRVDQVRLSLFDFLLSFEQLAMQIVFLASGHRHLVLHIAEVQNLLFKLLFNAAKLLSFGIQFRLHLVKVLIELLD